MKILMLTDRLDVGGAETHIAELCLGLRELGMQVETLSSGGAWADLLESQGIVCHRMPLCTHHPIKLLLLRRRIERLIAGRGYDVLHAHARIPAFLLHGLKRTGALRVVTVHAQFRSNRWMQRLCYWGERTVAVSEDLRRYVCDTYGLSGERVEVIPNGIDCKRFAPCKEERADGELRVLFASRLDADCALGAELLCRLAPVLSRSYPTVRVGIAGGGGAMERIEALASAANRAAGRECVQMLGTVRDLAPVMAEYDVFVGVSRAAMEASAAGCTVILCGNEGYLGVLDASNVERAAVSNFCCRGCAMASSFHLERDLRLLAEHPDVRKRCAKEGREGILRAFTAEQMCSATAALYQRRRHLPRVGSLLVGGYFGCGNAGDDAMLLGFLEEMRRIAPQVGIRALTADPRRQSERFGVPCSGRKNPIAVWRALRGADAFVCGGGSLFQNVTSRRSLSYYLSLLCAARLAGCKTVLYAVGIGPVNGARDRRRLAKELNRCAYISLRDPDSLRYLATIGVERSLLHLGADPALLLPPPPPMRLAALLRENGIATTAEDTVCMVVRQVPRHLWKSLITAMRLFCTRCGLRVVLVCLCEEDLGATQAASRLLSAPIISVRSVEDVAALLQGVRCVLSMRLHGIVLATPGNTPALGIVTDESDRKIPSFVRLSGQELLLYPRPAVAELIEHAEHCLSAASKGSRRLIANAVEEMQKKARKDLANIVDMLYNKGDDALHQTSTRENDQS